jgi:hypothetical protein
MANCLLACKRCAIAPQSKKAASCLRSEGRDGCCMSFCFLYSHSHAPKIQEPDCQIPVVSLIRHPTNQSNPIQSNPINVHIQHLHLLLAAHQRHQESDGQ